MARWFPQTVSSSASTTSRARTRYLTPLRTQVEAAIQAYLAANPDGEDVTLAVLKALGREALVALKGEEHLDRAKQDVGLLVAICLVDLYGPSRVLTFRENDGKAPSTRDAKRSGLDWVARYTPHRVLSEDLEDRIVLDTNAVRNHLQGATKPEDELDLDRLKQLKGRRKVSIADPSWAELIKALAEGRLPFAVWRARMDELDAVLDPELPIVPSGRELALLAGITQSRGFDPARMSAFYAAVWRYTRDATGPQDWARPFIVEYADGTREGASSLDPQRVVAAFAERHKGWSDFLERASKHAAPEAEGDLVDIIRASLVRDMGAQAVDRLTLLIHATARHEMRARTRPQDVAKADPNDAIDLDILYCVTLPAVLCTGDRRMRALAREVGASDGWRVMNAAELLGWLENQTTHKAG